MLLIFWNNNRKLYATLVTDLYILEEQGKDLGQGRSSTFYPARSTKAKTHTLLGTFEKVYGISTKSPEYSIPVCTLS